jgi:glycine/D-amino acid oxidase-like deaminating enzyme
VVGSKKPIKVAVIGGGCASIAAAFELTRPEHGGKYDVTVYQMGWRLGGKGASGRGAAGRVEEHGLHVQRNLRPNAFRYRASIKSRRMLDLSSCARPRSRTPIEAEVMTDDILRPSTFYSNINRWVEYFFNRIGAVEVAQLV